jgi:hypothetical protein
VAGHTQTPSNAAIFFADLFASLANVRVSAIPTHTGTPISRRRVSLISQPSAVIASGSRAMRGLTRRKASSML